MIFQMRSRPCLNIKSNAAAPLASIEFQPENYKALVDQSRAFLWARYQSSRGLAAQMQAAGEELAFEQRPQSTYSRIDPVQAHQDINLAGLDEADVVALPRGRWPGLYPSFFFVPAAIMVTALFPARPKGWMQRPDRGLPGTVYEKHQPPRQVILSHTPSAANLIAEALKIRAERRVDLPMPSAGRKTVDHAATSPERAGAWRKARRIESMEDLARWTRWSS